MASSAPSTRRRTPGAPAPATVLLVGAGDRMDDAVEQALVRRGIYVESCGLSDVQTAVLAAAPDLVLLLGDAAAQGGREALDALKQHGGTAAAAVAVLSDGEQLNERMAAFRHGAVAAIPRKASADEIGARVVGLLQEVPHRSGAVSGELGEATLDELTELVRRELRSGILSVEGGDSEPVRIVFGAGKPVSEALQEFVQKLRPLVQRTEALRYELLDEPESRLQLSAFPAGLRGNAAVFAGLSVLVVDNDSGRADALAQALRGAGSTVVVIGSSAADLSRTRDLDPDVVIFDQHALHGPDFDLIRHLRQDLRLRWASMLLADWRELWPDRSQPVDLVRLSRSVEPLVDGAKELAKLVESQHLFDTRLENTGPSRLLRTLCRAGLTFHVVVHSGRAMIEVDIADGLIVGALGTRPDGPPMEGVQAIAGLMALGSGRTRVERRDNPATANIMAPPEVALGAALSEKLPLLPSMLPNREHLKKMSSDPATAATRMAPAVVPRPQIPIGQKKPSEVPFRAPPGNATDQSWGGTLGAAPDRSLGPPRPGVHRIPLGSLEPPNEYSDTERPPEPSLETAEAQPDPFADLTEAADPPAAEPPSAESAIAEPAIAEPAAPEAAALEPLTPPVSEEPSISLPKRPNLLLRFLMWSIAAAGVVALGALIAFLATRGPEAVKGFELDRVASSFSGGGEGADPDRDPTVSSGSETTPTTAVTPVLVEDAPAEADALEGDDVAEPPESDNAPEPPEVDAVEAQLEVAEAEATPTPETAPAAVTPGGIDPSRSANSVIREGERLVRQGKVLESAAFFERALELRPDDNHGLIGMAQVWLARGDAAKAVPLAERAVELRSRRVPYRMILADAYHQNGQLAEARREYSKILRSEPGNRAAARALRDLQQ